MQQMIVMMMMMIEILSSQLVPATDARPCVVNTEAICHSEGSNGDEGARSRSNSYRKRKKEKERERERKEREKAQKGRGMKGLVERKEGEKVFPF